MKDQNFLQEKTFTIQKEGHQKPIHSFYNYRMAQLKSKVSFYEGQLDPLYNDNTALRQHLNLLFKSVSISSDILRKLLPTHNDPNKRLKLDLANLQEIAEMIAQDWEQLELTIKRQKLLIQNLNNKIGETLNKCQQDILLKELEFKNILEKQESIKNGLISKLQALQKQLKISQYLSNKKVDELQEKLSLKQHQFQSISREMQRLKYQTQERQSSFQKRIAHLADQIQTKYKEIEDAKIAVRAICDRFMNEKLAEQAQIYEYMLKTKEQQKMALALSKQESQQLLNRKIQVKQLQYQKLSKLNECHRLQIDQLNNKVYSMNDQLTTAKRVNTELQAQNRKATQTNNSLNKQLKMKEQQISQEKNALQNKIAKLTADLQSIKEEHLKEIQFIEQKHKQLEAELLEKQLKLRQFQAISKQFQKIWTAKIQKLKEEWKSNQQKLKKQILLKNNEIQSQKEALNQIKYQYEKQILDMKEQNRQTLEGLQTKYKKATESLIKQHNQTLKNLKEELQEDLIKDRLQYEKKIASLQNQYQNQKVKMTQEFKQKFEEQKKTFLSQQSQLQNKMKNIQLQAQLTKKKLLKAQNKIKQYDKQIEKINAQNYKKLKSLQQKSEEQKRKLNERLQQQLLDFQRQLQEQISSMCAMKNELQHQVVSLKEQKGVTIIQQNNRKEIEELKQKFSSDLKQIEESYYKKFNDFRDSHYREIDQIKKASQIELQNIQNQHKVEIQMINLGFHKDLIGITQLTENKLTCINDRLIFGIHTDDLLKVEKSLLINYVVNGVQKLKQIISGKENEIVQLQLALQKKQKQIEAYEKCMQQKVKAKKQEYDALKQKIMKQMEIVQSNCKSELLKAQKQKIEYTQKIYEQFCVLKTEHQKKYQALISKYMQLQRLFDSRPSRVEDVTKIKELISQKDKMNYQMQSYQKKVDTANQIVRYLNFELENYKSTYDIFGPNPNSMSPNVSPSKTISFKEQVSVAQSFKMNKLQKMKDQYRSLIREVSLARRQTESPLLKELKVFQEPNGQQTLFLQSKESQQLRHRKLSLISQKGSMRKERIKTEKVQGGQIITHAQNFIKIINDTKKEGFISLQEVQKSNIDPKRKTYRKRKLSKKIATQGSEHYF